MPARINIGSGVLIIPRSYTHSLNFTFTTAFVNVIPFSRTSFDVEKFKEMIKGPKVFVQAPIKYQPFVEEYYDGLLPDDGFLKEVSKRTGYERPE